MFKLFFCIVIILLLQGCLDFTGSTLSEEESKLVGTWVDDYGQGFIFKRDRTYCTIYTGITGRMTDCLGLKWKIDENKIISYVEEEDLSSEVELGSIEIEGDNLCISTKIFGLGDEIEIKYRREV